MMSANSNLDNLPSELLSYLSNNFMRKLSVLISFVLVVYSASTVLISISLSSILELININYVSILKNAETVSNEF